MEFRIFYFLFFHPKSDHTAYHGVVPTKFVQFKTEFLFYSSLVTFLIVVPYSEEPTVFLSVIHSSIRVVETVTRHVTCGWTGSDFYFGLNPYVLLVVDIWGYLSLVSVSVRLLTDNRFRSRPTSRDYLRFLFFLSSLYNVLDPFSKVLFVSCMKTLFI